MLNASKHPYPLPYHDDVEPAVENSKFANDKGEMVLHRHIKVKVNTVGRRDENGSTEHVRNVLVSIYTQKGCEITKRGNELALPPDTWQLEWHEESASNKLFLVH